MHSSTRRDSVTHTDIDWSVRTFCARRLVLTFLCFFLFQFFLSHYSIFTRTCILLLPRKPKCLLLNLLPLCVFAVSNAVSAFTESGRKHLYGTFFWSKRDQKCWLLLFSLSTNLMIIINMEQHTRINDFSYSASHRDWPLTPRTHMKLSEARSDLLIMINDDDKYLLIPLFLM